MAADNLFIHGLKHTPGPESEGKEFLHLPPGTRWQPGVVVWRDQVLAVDFDPAILKKKLEHRRLICCRQDLLLDDGSKGSLWAHSG